VYRTLCLISRAVDPDPAFQVNPDMDPDLMRIQDFDDQKPKKKLQLNLFSFF
jgi:hypothetical protein